MYVQLTGIFSLIMFDLKAFILNLLVFFDLVSLFVWWLCSDAQQREFFFSFTLNITFSFVE